MLIWITGASSGLGREVARQYAFAGHSVCVSARNEAGLNTLAEECRAASGAVHAVPLDVTDAAQAAAAVESIRSRFGLPDLAILNAGTHVPDRVGQFDRALYGKIMNINFMGTINCLDALIPACIEHRAGHIAIVSSVAGYRGLPGATAYGASKAALINLCEGLQPELRRYGVDLSVINPGFVRTPLTDKNDFAMPFLMEVDDAARSMIRGLETRRFEITFPRRFTWLLKCLRILPIAVYLRVTRGLVKDD